METEEDTENVLEEYLENGISSLDAESKMMAVQNTFNLLKTTYNNEVLDSKFPQKFITFDTEFTAALKTTKTLLSLTFYTCKFTPAACTALYEVLAANKYIQFLDIGGLYTSPGSYNLVIKGIATNSTLNYLLADFPSPDNFDAFDSMLKTTKKLILHEDHGTMTSLYTENDEYYEILEMNEDFCDERDSNAADLLNVSRKLLLFDLPLEIKNLCLEMVMKDYFPNDHLRLSNVSLDPRFIGKIDGSDARRLIQSCYLCFLLK